MTIHDIKALSHDDAPHFFSRRTLRFFGQTMRSFSVRKQPDGRYRIAAPIRHDGRIVSHTVRDFDPETNPLNLE